MRFNNEFTPESHDFSFQKLYPKRWLSLAEASTAKSYRWLSVVEASITKSNRQLKRSRSQSELSVAALFLDIPVIFFRSKLIIIFDNLVFLIFS